MLSVMNSTCTFNTRLVVNDVVVLAYIYDMYSIIIVI